MQDAAEAVGRNNDQRKVLVCVTWEKLVPSPFFNSVLWLSSAGHEFGFCESFHPWSTPGCGGDGWEPLLCSLLPLMPQRLFAAASGSGARWALPEALRERC